ncbi:hypothetical protein M0R45_014815 [Rubus argutus]|uniref:Uncharacterized protein n=1 Tax=Rubus argutus TaxID=59490 RepID=A0AAW1XQ99_RUBAR
MLDSVQGVLSGVARGCGWQHLAMYLKLYAKGPVDWLICGLSCQAGTLLLITLRTKWNRLDLSHNAASSV